jgi:signal transduction histidine kinase
MKVLVAEDSAVMRHALLALLRQWDYVVAEARDGREAWELFQQDDIPLVLTDWMMPEMDGLELMRNIRSRDLSGYVYIILLTAKTEKADLVEAMEAGADDFLSKPVDPDELRVRLHAGQRIINLERVLAEQNRQIRETQAALIHSEKLASLGQLAAGMAHEINNPLSYVTNNLAVLKRDVLDIVQVLETLDGIQQELAASKSALANRIAELRKDYDLDWIQQNLPRLLEASAEGLGRVRDTVRNLRDFAHLDEAELDEVDLNAALESTLEILRHEIDTHRIVVMKQLQPLPRILCRPDKINQVLHSLLLNAVQASEPEGIVHVRTFGQDDEVVLEVQDEGCGIDSAQLPRIFEPFFTTRAVGSGAGLGLTVSYGIVRDHGGKIDVESEVGRGSLFRVHLPIQHEPGS